MTSPIFHIRSLVGAVLPAVVIVLLAQGAILAPAFALSEIQREELPPVETDDAPSADTPATNEDAVPQEALDPEPEPIQPPATGMPVPMPEPPSSPLAPAQASPAEDGEDEDAPVEDDETATPDEPAAPLPAILYDLSLLPEPVRRKHAQIIEACRSGEIEQLRPLLEPGERGTQLSFGGVDGDPIDFLKQMSGDSEGQEILAILLEVLSAGYVNLEPGQPEELYVWPYFFAIPLDRLDARQRVELFKIITAGDYEDMKTYGAYVFYRLGITPEGRWAFFVAGD